MIYCYILCVLQCLIIRPLSVSEIEKICKSSHSMTISPYCMVNYQALYSCTNILKAAWESPSTASKLTLLTNYIIVNYINNIATLKVMQCNYQ